MALIDPSRKRASPEKSQAIYCDKREALVYSVGLGFRYLQYVLIQLIAKSIARLVPKHPTLRLATKFVIYPG